MAATWGLQAMSMPKKILIAGTVVGLAAGVIAERTFSPDSIKKHEAGEKFRATHDIPDGAHLSVTPSWWNSAKVGVGSVAITSAGAGLFLLTKDKPGQLGMIGRVAGLAMAALGAASLVSNVASFQLR